ncbi:MAG TPA: hypothetical protein VLV88_15220 [Terriglobales bacterium]|nr:hypothetical protein [Terriglobales bacterium]
MKSSFQFVGLRLVLVGALSAAACAVSFAQVPAPVIDTTAAIVVKAVTAAHHSSPYPKFQGTVVNANVAQITVRAKDNELDLQTFSLSQEVSQKMQAIIDKGGYQYGDKVTIYYDPTSHVAMKIKGKPSKPI